MTLSTHYGIACMWFRAIKEERLAVRNTIVLVLLTILVALPATAQSQGDLSVRLTTTPEINQIGPDNTFVRTTLSVVDAKGQAVSNAYLKLHLMSPPGNPIISTDFPIVENTSLLKYEGTLPTGTLEFDSIYPIRGEYSFQVEAGRDPSNLSFKDTLHLGLSENRNEVMNATIMMAILLGLGLVAGLIIGNGARARRMATAGLILALGVGLISSGTAVVRAQDGDHDGHEASAGAAPPPPPFTEHVTQGELTLTYAMDPGVGEVGKLNTLSFTATDGSGALIPDTTFDVKFWHIEDDKPVFATTLYAPTGQTQFEFQFFDGAEHEIWLTAHNALGQVELNKVVTVKGIEPPLSVRIKTTVFLTLITLVGILIGLRIQLSRGKTRELVPMRI